MKDWRIHEQIGANYYDKGDAAGAAQAYLNAAMSDEYLRSQRSHYSNYLFALHYLDGISNEDLAREHFIYGSLYRDVEQIELNRVRAEGDRPTIGYIATDFTESSVMRFAEAILMRHSDEFVIKLFSLTSETDGFTERLKGHVDKYIELSNVSIEESAQRIAAEQVDILFDLSGHSDGGLSLQILGYKPAPVQIVGIGWFDTTGMSAVDYILTDNYLTPIGHEKYFSERLLRLSGAFSFMPVDLMTNIEIEKRQKNPRLLSDMLIFGSYNNFMKVTDEYLKCVKRILKNVKNSRFILQDTTTITERKLNMEKRIKEIGLPVDRVEVRLGQTDYLQGYEDIDIILDTFPYNGGMMTATALYMGVPVVSLYGQRYSARFGADILRLAGITELIANDTKEYIKLAVELAMDSERLNTMHETLRQNLEHSKLLDTARYVVELEQAYRNILSQER